MKLWGIDKISFSELSADRVEEPLRLKIVRAGEGRGEH